MAMSTSQARVIVSAFGLTLERYAHLAADGLPETWLPYKRTRIEDALFILWKQSANQIERDNLEVAILHLADFHPLIKSGISSSRLDGGTFDDAYLKESLRRQELLEPQRLYSVEKIKRLKCVNQASGEVSIGDSQKKELEPVRNSSRRIIIGYILLALVFASGLPAYILKLAPESKFFSWCVGIAQLFLILAPIAAAYLYGKENIPPVLDEIDRRYRPQAKPLTDKQLFWIRLLWVPGWVVILLVVLFAQNSLYEATHAWSTWPKVW